MSNYKKLTDKEHILLRPGMYIGQINPENLSDYIFDNDKIIQKNLFYSPGFYKIFDEILVNTIDHAVRTKDLPKKDQVSIIKVDINQNENCISIFNNGFPVDTKKHLEYNEYVPELIFANLRTSENYDDNLQRITGGMNGYGSKLTNIFSKKFIIEIGNSKTKEKYIQIFENNLSIINEPKITKYTKSEDYLKITYFPDLEKFKMIDISNDILNLFKKRTYDLVATTRWISNKISVYFNNELIPITRISEYVKMYNLSSEILCENNENWDVYVSMSNEDFKQISFVNGIYTRNGGKHVDYITNQIIDKIYEILEKKNKDIPIKKSFIKNNLFVFIRCNIHNPSFSSQIKDELTTPISKFGTEIQLSKKFTDKIGNLGIYQKVLELAEFKNKSNLKKTDGKKKRKLYIPKYISAEYSGTLKSNECTLILTEGDSGLTMAISGLTQEQRKYFGLFPLKGKMINVRDLSGKRLLENDEINNLKKIMGLEHNKEYTNTNSLRYGKLLIFSDQDEDGFHIKGLLFNIFSVLWPSLFKFDNFLNSFLTPIVKVSKGNNNIISFYNLSDYKKWKLRNETKGYTIKYYKGLGTSTKKEAKEYFENIQENLIQYNYSKKSDDALDLAFNKKRADDRKKWLLDFKEPKELNKNSLTFDEFINNELVLFSMEDVARNIPNILDGLKTSQRKVLYAALKRNLVSEIKVSQFAGYTSEVSSYHHGEKSLEDTIINMARDFIGTNNINLFNPIGQFGSRLTAKDNASSRYIFTKLKSITKLIFNHNDNQLLKYLDDDGFSIEPEYYFPVIPMLLINGTRGIGTGFSTVIPNYNPIDIIENIKLLLNNKKIKQINPWYKNFLGNIKKTDIGFETIGNYTYDEKNNIITITELPIGTWTSPYKEFLIELVNSNKIKDFIDKTTDEIINFKIQLNSNERIKDFNSFFKLTSKISLNNMHLFDKNNKIKKYKNIEDIQIEFFNERIKFYELRKEFILKDLKNKLEKLSEKVRFIQYIRENKINIKLPSNKINELLIQFKFIKIDENYNYLIDIPIKNISQDNIDKMEKEMKDMKKEFDLLKNKTIKELYLEDLIEIEKILY